MTRLAVEYVIVFFLYVTLKLLHSPRFPEKLKLNTLFIIIFFFSFGEQCVVISGNVLNKSLSRREIFHEIILRCFTKRNKYQSAILTKTSMLPVLKHQNTFHIHSGLVIGYAPYVRCVSIIL